MAPRVGHPPETKSVQTIYPTALLRGFFIAAESGTPAQIN